MSGHDDSAPGRPDASVRAPGLSPGDPGSDSVRPPLTKTPDRDAEALGALTCWKCGAAAFGALWGDAFVPTCVLHQPDDASS